MPLNHWRNFQNYSSISPWHFPKCHLISLHLSTYLDFILKEGALPNYWIWWFPWFLTSISNKLKPGSHKTFLKFMIFYSVGNGFSFGNHPLQSVPGLRVSRIVCSLVLSCSHTCLQTSSKGAMQVLLEKQL